jgi:single-strand DNA-binding protein
MNDTHITLHGWVGGDVRHREVNGVNLSTLRVGVTPRVRRNGEWTDGETTWFTVTAWRALAERVRDSINRGDAVIVHGRLSTRTWTDDKGQPVTTLEVEASYMGHDLSRGTTVFTKAGRPEAGDSDLDQQVAALVAETSSEAPPMTSWGVGGADRAAEEPAA